MSHPYARPPIYPPTPPTPPHKAPVAFAAQVLAALARLGGP